MYLEYVWLIDISLVQTQTRCLAAPEKEGLDSKGSSCEG